MTLPQLLDAWRRSPYGGVAFRNYLAYEYGGQELGRPDDVQAALEALPPEYRAAVVLCDIEGFSYEEIAVTLGVKLGTVRSRIHRGRAQLRAALEHRRPTSAETASARGTWGQGLRRQGLVPRLKRTGRS